MEKMLKLATALYENYSKINYYTFLESLTTEKNKTLIEAVTKGFVSVYLENMVDEADVDVEDIENAPAATEEKVKVAGSTPPEFKHLVDITRKLDNLVTGLNPRQVTENMYKVIKGNNVVVDSEGKKKLMNGKVSTTPVEKFSDFDIVSSYEYTPEGETTPEDIRNAKSVLASMVFKRIVYQAVMIGRSEDYKEAAYAFIADCLEKLGPAINKFEYNGKASFLSYFEWIMTATKQQALSDVQETQRVANVWKNKDWPKGTVVNWKRANYKAKQDVAASENAEPGLDHGYFWERIQDLGDKISTDAPVSASGDDGDSISVGETIEGDIGTAGETEAKATLSKMLDKLPKDAETQKKVAILKEYFMDDVKAIDLSKKYGVSDQTILNWIMGTMKALRAANGLKNPEGETTKTFSKMS